MRVLQVGLSSILIVTLAASLPGVYYYTESGAQPRKASTSPKPSRSAIDRLDLKTVKEVPKPPKPSPSALPETNFELGDLSRSQRLKAQRVLRVNINEATIGQLKRIPGVGPATARNIIKYRRQNGIDSVNELTKISGIGPATVEKMKEKIIVQGRMPGT